MMRFGSLPVAGALALFGTLAGAQPAPADKTAAAPASAKYSTTTTSIGTLLADPVAKALLAKLIPDIVGNQDVVERAGGLTLKEVSDTIKAYSPDVLSDKVLAHIDAELAKLPAK